MRTLFLSLLVFVLGCPKETPTSTPAQEQALATLVGKKSVMVMQSPVSPSMSPDGESMKMWYLDVGGEPGKQVTLYSAEIPDCPGDIEVTGKPRTVVASKGGEDQTFTQYDVVRWRCL